MKRSDGRILTTHTGSLPRPPDLVSLLNKKEMGEAYERQAFEARVRAQYRTSCGGKPTPAST